MPPRPILQPRGQKPLERPRLPPLRRPFIWPRSPAPRLADEGAKEHVRPAPQRQAIRPPPASSQAAAQGFELRRDRQAPRPDRAHNQRLHRQDLQATWRLRPQRPRTTRPETQPPPAREVDHQEGTSPAATRRPPDDP